MRQKLRKQRGEREFDEDFRDCRVNERKRNKR